MVQRLCSKTKQIDYGYAAPRAFQCCFAGRSPLLVRMRALGFQTVVFHGTGVFMLLIPLQPTPALDLIQPILAYGDGADEYTSECPQRSSCTGCPFSSIHYTALIAVRC